MGFAWHWGPLPLNSSDAFLRPTPGPAVIGLALAMAVLQALAATLENLLFGVTPGAPATFIGIAALLIVVAAIAGYLAGRGASRIDPMAALQTT